MQIWRSLDDVPADLARSAVVIGNFDGVHRGHQAVIGRARAVADAQGLTVVAVTFDPHPMAVLRPEHAPSTLTSIEGRAELLAERRGGRRPGAAVRPRHGRLVARAVHRPGARRLPARRRGRGRRQLPVRQPGRRATWRRSTRRGSRATSSPRECRSTAARRCGRRRTSGCAWPPATSPAPPRRSAGPSPSAAWSSRGDKRGRELGFPTANVPTSAVSAAPADGVYAGWLRRLDTGETFPAAISVGTNPTFDGERDRRVESYVARPRRPRAVRRRGRGGLRRPPARDGARSSRSRSWSSRCTTTSTAPASCWRREALPPARPLADTEAWFVAARAALLRARGAGRQRAAALRLGRTGPAGAARRPGGGGRRLGAGAGQRRVQRRAGRRWSPSAWSRRSGTPSPRCGPGRSSAWALRRTFGSLRHPAADGDPRAAAAAAVRHVPVHQRRGLGGRRRPRRR